MDREIREVINHDVRGSAITAKEKHNRNAGTVVQISPIYCLLDFDKDDFCKLIDAIGIEKWLAKSERWERLDRAEQELYAKERYRQAKERIKAIELEIKDRQNELKELDELCGRYERQ